MTAMGINQPPGRLGRNCIQHFPRRSITRGDSLVHPPSDGPEAVHNLVVV
jgi:hypothetical protein